MGTWVGSRSTRASLVGLTAALAFLAINLGMEMLGWLVGGPARKNAGR